MGATDNKLRELALYVAKKSEADRHFGATKLNRILFFSDFWAYGQLGSPITGAEYRRLDDGPAPRRMLPLTKDMQKRGEAAIAEREHYGRRQRRLIALREPDLGEFSGAEIAIVDDVIRELWGRNATEASELSHRFQGWQLARDQETIPYESVFLGNPRPLTETEIAHGRRLAAELRNGDVAAA